MITPPLPLNCPCPFCKSNDVDFAAIGERILFCRCKHCWAQFSIKDLDVRGTASRDSEPTAPIWLARSALIQLPAARMIYLANPVIASDKSDAR